MVFKNNIHCIERTEHVLEELDIFAIKVYVYYYYYYYYNVDNPDTIM